MIFNFLKARNLQTTDTEMAAIEGMLNRTWDLNRKFDSGPDPDKTTAVSLFNMFFEQLHEIITRILQSVVSLSSEAPALFRFASNFKEVSLTQEQNVSDIARAGVDMASRTRKMSEQIQSLAVDSEEIKDDVQKAAELSGKAMDQFTGINGFMADLVDTTAALDEHSTSIGSIIDILTTISDETNILSLNARIEAIKSTTGAAGFKVIAEEIAQLAKQSKSATTDIQSRLTQLQARVADTVTAVKNVETTVKVGKQCSAETQDSLENVVRRFESFADSLNSINQASLEQDRDVTRVSDEILQVETSVRRQSETVGRIVDVAETITRLCDTMVVDTGTFHLSGHARARQAASSMAADPDIRSMEPSRQETAVRSWMKRNPFIELVYITDETGRQVIRNIYSEKVPGRDQLDTCIGNDWSTREWFTAPRETGTAFVSQTYRSSATDRFCFTVSVPLEARPETLSGILAIDINVEDMLSI